MSRSSAATIAPQRTSTRKHPARSSLTGPKEVLVGSMQQRARDDERKESQVFVSEGQPLPEDKLDKLGDQKANNHDCRVEPIIVRGHPTTPSFSAK